MIACVLVNVAWPDVPASGEVLQVIEERVVLSAKYES